MHIEKALEVRIQPQRGGKIERWRCIHRRKEYLLAACEFFCNRAMGLQPDHTH